MLKGSRRLWKLCPIKHSSGYEKGESTLFWSEVLQIWRCGHQETLLKPLDWNQCSWKPQSDSTTRWIMENTDCLSCNTVTSSILNYMYPSIPPCFSVSFPSVCPQHALIHFLLFISLSSILKSFSPSFLSSLHLLPSFLCSHHPMDLFLFPLLFSFLSALWTFEFTNLTVDHCLALSPQSKKLPGSIPGWGTALCGVCVFTPCLCRFPAGYGDFTHHWNILGLSPVSTHDRGAGYDLESVPSRQAVAARCPQGRVKCRDLTVHFVCDQ